MSGYDKSMFLIVMDTGSGVKYTLSPLRRFLIKLYFYRKNIITCRYSMGIKRKFFYISVSLLRKYQGETWEVKIRHFLIEVTDFYNLRLINSRENITGTFMNIYF